jgi:hypothetical protein
MEEQKAGGSFFKTAISVYLGCQDLKRLLNNLMKPTILTIVFG